MRDEVRKVYYSNFWYTAGVFSKADSLTQNAVKIKIRQVIDELRLLALIYDEIYIPRSHFLTSFTDAHNDFISGVIQSKEFNWLMLNGILVSSVSPKTDSKSDTNRIYERASKIKWLNPALSRKDTSIISQIKPIKVDSKAEANHSLMGYSKVAKTIEQARNVNGLLDMISNSNYKDIEFFHEKFLKNLRESSLEQGIKEEFWRATNEVYLANIGSELGNIFVPYNEVESRYPRNKLGDARLYNADTLRVIINIILGPKKYLLWLKQDIDKALDFRVNNTWEWIQWKNFQNAYFELLLEFNKILDNICRIQNIEIADVNTVIISEMTKITDNWGGDIISAFTQAAGGIAQLEDPIMGIATKTSTAGLTKLLNRFIRYCVLNFRYKSITTFMRCVIANTSNR